MFEDWNGKFIKSIYHINGELFLLDAKKHMKRSLTEECSEIIDWYTCGSSDGGSTRYCNFNYSETIFRFCGGGTGGGGESSSNYEPAGGGGGGGGGSFTTGTEVVENRNCNICPVGNVCLAGAFKKIPLDDGTGTSSGGSADCPNCSCLPEVVPEPEVIIDDSFENTKADCVYNKLQGSSNGFKTAIQKFDGEFPVAHLKFSISNSLPDNVNARTIPPINYIIEIQMNGNNFNRPNLSIARTLIHETIHAEMFRKMLSLANSNGAISVSKLKLMLQNNDFPGMLDYYTRFGVNGFQHEQMAQHYRNTIISILKGFDSQQSAEVYEALSWVGLYGTTAWNNLSSEDKAKILQIIINFKSKGAELCN